MEESFFYRARPDEDVQDTIFWRCPLKMLVFDLMFGVSVARNRQTLCGL